MEHGMKHASLLACLGLSVAFAPVAGAAVITGLTATANSENVGVGRTADKAVNGVGLTGLNHSTLNTDGWETAATPFPPYPAWLKIELPTAPGELWNINSIRIWNRNDEAFYYRQARNITVETSADGVEWVERMNVDLLTAPGTPPTPTDTYQGELFSFSEPWRYVKYVRITINSMYPDGNGQGHVGIAEVQLDGYLPEPAAGTAMALAGAALLRRRRG
jgi:hypothetical protein